MSKFDLRDIQQRLTGSRDVDAVVNEFLGYLQSARSDWKATLSFYDVSLDTLVSAFELQELILVRRDIAVPVDHLPPRLVRKFFHPSAISSDEDTRKPLFDLFERSPFYDADREDAKALEELTPARRWLSCLCVPLADHENLLAVLVITSPRKDAFGGRVARDLAPIVTMASVALSQHLYRVDRPHLPRPADEAESATASGTEFQESIRRLEAVTPGMPGGEQVGADKISALARELDLLNRTSGEHQQELERVKIYLSALQEQTTAASAQIDEASHQLAATQDRTSELSRTVGFLKDVFQALAEEHDAADFTSILLSWFSEHFGIERCSLMVVDGNGETMRIAAQRGIDPDVAARVKVRVGQGISGWVAHNRQPLLIRVKADAQAVEYTGQDVYNSDSFIVVPLTHRGQTMGVLNLSNKSAGLPFDELDLDRAVVVGSLLGLTIASEKAARHTAAW
jgi:signal transduction protein with GAF and PtsI domain